MIDLSGICRQFTVGDQTVQALSDVNLHIGDGEYVAIMGASGSGKSTLLNVLGLLDRASSGTYRLDGRDTTGLDETEQARLRRERIGFVFQSFHLVPRLTAFDNVALPLMLAGVPEAERLERVGALMQRFGLAERQHHKPDQLSGGQRQRVAIARATVLQPTVLLADEPTGNLDHQTGREVMELLEDLNRQGVTLIMVTHDPELGERAHRRIRMRDGRVVEDAEKPCAPA